MAGLRVQPRGDAETAKNGQQYRARRFSPLERCAVPALAGAQAEFLRHAMEGDNSEIAFGRVAEARGASPGVRDFGRTLEQDHAQAKDQAMNVARQQNVPPTDAMSPQAGREAAKLRRRSG